MKILFFFFFLPQTNQNNLGKTLKGKGTYSWVGLDLPAVWQTWNEGTYNVVLGHENAASLVLTCQLF